MAKFGLRKLDEELEDDELRVEDAERPIILPLDSIRRNCSSGFPQVDIYD